MPDWRLSRAAVLLAASLSMSLGLHARAYEFADNMRWSRTATDGFGLVQGDPTTLTWSLAPDGTQTTGGGASIMIQTLDNLYGVSNGGSDLTTRPWFQYFDNGFNRLEQVSGLTFVYEDDDDGVAQTTSNRGILNVRGDIRIAGRSIDGQSGSNTLAFNSFPNNGEMVIDTDNTNFFGPGNTANNGRAFRNLVMHEVGHGVGISHVISDSSSSATTNGCMCSGCLHGVTSPATYPATSPATGVQYGQFLMEPFISTAFDGPQFDDILALHRGYGDVYEKSNGGAGNDTAANATALGTLGFGSMLSIGTDANDTVVAANDIDFVSIDDNSDTDFFRFTMSQGGLLDIVLTPMGPTYNTAPQTDPATPQTPYDSSALSDLSLTLFDTNGTSLLASSNTVGNGDMESILGFNISTAGDYFVRITGADEFAQFYQLDLLATLVPLVLGDLNGDQLVNDADLAIIMANYGKAVTSGSLIDGDPTADGLVDASDLNVVLRNWTGNVSPSAVNPEPGSFALVGGLMGLTVLRRRRSADRA